MGLCDNALEVQEPLVRACVEVEPNSVSEVLPCSENALDFVDSGTGLASAGNRFSELSRNDDAVGLLSDVAETAVVDTSAEVASESGSGDGLVSGNLIEVECGASGECLNNLNADCMCSSCGIETELVNGLTEMACEGENMVSLTSEKLPVDVCGDSLNEAQGGILDSSVQNDGACVVKQGFAGESNGSVGSLENSDSLKEDCQRNDYKDDKSIVVTEVMEQKSNYSAGMGNADDEETTPSPGCELHPTLKVVSCCSIFSANQNEQDCVAPLKSVIEERGAELDGLEANNPFLPSESVPEDKHKDDQIMRTEKFPAEGALDFANEAAHVSTGFETAPNHVMSTLAHDNCLELRPMVDLSESIVDEDGEKDNSPASAARNEGVMEMTNDVSSRIETVLSHNMSASPIINKHLESITQQSELDMQNISGSASAMDLEQRSNSLVSSEVDMCTQRPQYGGEIPMEFGQIICPEENDFINGRGINSVTVEGTPKEIEEGSAAEGYAKALPLLDGKSTVENTNLDVSVNDVLQHNEQCDDRHFDCSSTKSLSEVAEEKIDCKTDMKVEIIGQIFCEDRNAKDQKEGSDEFPSSCSANKPSPEPFQTLVVDERGSSKRSHLLGKDIKDPISFSNTVEFPGQTDIRVENEDIIYRDSEFKCDDLIPTSSQKSSQTSKIIWKPQTKRAARKCRKKPLAASLNEIIESILKAPRSKRSLNANPGRSNIWGSLYTDYFDLNNELKLNNVQNNGQQKLKNGRGNGKRTSSGVGRRSRRKSRENRSSTSCIRLKVKVGKEVCQNSLDGMFPEVIDSSASTDAANAMSCAKDKTGEKSAKMQLKCHDNKPGVVDTCSDASLLNLHQANQGLEGTLSSQNQAGDAAENYLGVSDLAEAEELEAVIEKRYTDPGTSPDSEVINSIPEGQVGIACQEDLPEASKTGATAPNVTTVKKGKKKDRNLCSDNHFKKDKSSGAANKSKTKPRKNCPDGQRKDESVCSSEILTSSTSVIASPRVTEFGVPKKGLMVDFNTEVKTHSDLDVDLDLAGSHNLKNGPPSTKSKVRQKKSDREEKGTSKVHDPDRSKKKNGFRQRGNERKAVNKKKVKEKAVSVQVNEVDDDCGRGNHSVDESGKMDAADNSITLSMGMVDLDLASRNVLDENLPADSAWVHCDDCHKWRRIPVSLVDSIGQTNCQWICKDNTDKAFADCSIPQEKSNAEINAELGISDVDEDAYDVHLNSRGIDFMHDRGSKEYEFTRISTNQFLHRSRKTQTIDEIMVCHCRPPLNGGLGCGDECLNRMLNIECVRGTCPCGDLCSNQQFQKRSYARMKWDRCGKKGFGLRLEEDISKGHFLIEYVGEVLDMHTYEARQKEYASNGHKHFYFMTLDGSEVIDACAKGNLGRFINHSCDPNCRTEKWVVNGEICIGLFAMRDIKKDEEVTFDYNYVRVFGAAAKKCYCGSSQCRGYIGGDPSSTEVIDQVDSDEEFPEPVMIEEVQGRNGLQNKLPRRSSSDAVEMQIAENLSKNRDKLDNCRKPVGKLEVMNQPAASTSLLDSSVEIIDTKTCVPSSSEAVKTSVQADVSSKTTSSVQQDILEEITEKLSSSQTLETSPTANGQATSDGITNKKSKSGASEEKRVFVKSRFLIKTSHKPCIVKKEKSIVSALNVNKSSTNKHQVVPVKSKKLVEGASNGRFEAVEEKLNELLDIDGGISKRKDAPKGYLKLLLHTAASGANKNGEAIQSNRDLSMILDALLKTKSRVVLVDIIDKNGLRMLHNMLKVYRRDFKKTPILRKLLKVLEYLENRQILTSEHIYGDAPCRGMESFRESMLSLTEHDDKQVHQIARSFRDRWFPRNFRKISHMDRDDGRIEFNGGSNSSRTSASHNYRCDQGAKAAVTVDSIPQSKVGTTLNTALQEPSSASGSTRNRKRKSRWDQPAEEKPVSLQNSEQKVESMLPQQSESNALRDTVNKEDASCPHCYLNYCLQNEACHVEDASQDVLEDAPPGFSSPRNCSLALSSVTETPQQGNSLLDGVIGHPEIKFNSRLPVSYGIPMPIVQQFGSLNAENESWIIAPGMPFHPFPPLPPFPQKRKETLVCPATPMSIDENAGQQHDSCVSASSFASENNPSTTKTNQPDMHFPGANNQQVLKRPREFSNDLGKRYFRQQKCNLPPWTRKRNGWNT